MELLDRAGTTAPIAEAGEHGTTRGGRFEFGVRERPKLSKFMKLSSSKQISLHSRIRTQIHTERQSTETHDEIVTSTVLWQGELVERRATSP